MMHLDTEALDLRIKYNKILLTLIEKATVGVSMSGNGDECTIDISIWNAEHSNLNSEVDLTKSWNPAFFAPNNDDVMNLDLLQEENVVPVMLYSAVVFQWPSLYQGVLFSAKNFHNGTAFNKCTINRMKNNLGILSTYEYFEFLTNQNINDEIKTLIRTLALYFYIRVFCGSMRLNFNQFMKKSYKWEICKIIQNNGELEAFLRYLYKTNICKVVFKSIITEEDESIFEAKLEQIFNYVIENSYYAHLPRGLNGLTANWPQNIRRKSICGKRRWRRRRDRR
ncbi:unnamed protein product [Blepharisma stoltei]|uniref:Uncharacterized protein n=1 Tax=Blepharisma stoltei TaxID=1481888 RepID=A0AAU9I901_9CILI|nr:unnamed protein product [Blepharisma stoltei]